MTAPDLVPLNSLLTPVSPEIVRPFGLTVIAVEVDEAARKFPFAALVAVTMQVPTAVGVRIESETVQGPELTTNEFPPCPSPPEVVNESVEP